MKVAKQTLFSYTYLFRSAPSGAAAGAAGAAAVGAAVGAASAAAGAAAGGGGAASFLAAPPKDSLLDPAAEEWHLESLAAGRFLASWLGRTAAGG